MEVVVPYWNVKNGQESPLEPLCSSQVLSDKHKIWKTWLLDAKFIGLYNVHCKSKHSNKTHTTSKLRYDNNSFITKTYQPFHIIVVCTLPSWSLMTFFNRIILSNFKVDVLKIHILEEIHLFWFMNVNKMKLEFQQNTTL